MSTFSPVPGLGSSKTDATVTEPLLENVEASPVRQHTATADTKSDAAQAYPLHAAAQMGDAQTIHRLITQDGFDPNSRDAANATPLHWAAINNALLACKELLNAGAEVDALGGELIATPLHWAARNGHLDTAHLLIVHGADPAVTDSQGFDTFHLATHSSAPLLLAYLLTQQLPVATDATDGDGRTCLHWACYQGDAISVSLLLMHGSNPNAKDPSGMSALHWAVVKGNINCIAKIIEAGGDPRAKNEEGLTPMELAQKLKSILPWNRAMAQAKRQPDGSVLPRRLSDKQTTIAVLLLPTPVLGIAFKTLDILPWYTGLPLAFAEFFALNHVVTRVLLAAPPRQNGMSDATAASPYLCGVLAGSLFWVGETWVTRLATHTPGYAVHNLAFAIAFIVCTYNFVRAICLDAGKCAKPHNNLEIKETVESLTKQGAFNGMNFCLVCMARKPLRSKHCKLCHACIARHDHHCPWLWNCVGVNNHRQFVLFVSSMIAGVILYAYLSVAYFAETSPSYQAGPENLCYLPESFCAAAQFDGVLFASTTWACIQLTWTSIVLVGQLYQICRQMTTLEMSNLGRFGTMGGRAGSSLAEQSNHPSVLAAKARQTPSGDTTAAETLASIDTDENGSTALSSLDNQPVTPSYTPRHSHGCGCCSCIGRILPASLLSVIGLDLYTRGGAASGLVKTTQSPSNPFDLGLIRNCTDFWTRGRTLGVDYTALYDVPPEGYRSVLRRRADQASEDSRSGKRSSTSRSTGYEMVRSEDA
ncbi:uncharacterized protein L969DRAFT_18289 [Mixia osmundae IAM 14324]|uniref:Palmitoyltransferase n=1 Tax=Mixia osmundae (strain CBS 9802 / IAM 14324 / JCM 22182 / KY 12970) TaxID=764103 RepID=G7DZ58_MIXOS|nr:uncharacterized protein L969DRAFT_18289 [Mixia osmundae IAM 14324]KEI38269.1 hypothetical protein L969DRAFT_18289 [Mixia osmundae IAM 14324]GAA95868.1 hypothetical protein E5Q_02525 [Mixia osmundae IAM 14324]